MTYFPGNMVLVYNLGTFTLKPSASRLTDDDLHRGGFTPDVGGIYVVGGMTVTVASLLKRKIESTVPVARTRGTVFLFFDQGVAVASTVANAGQITPRIDGDGNLAKLAARDPNVTSELASLVGKSAASIAAAWSSLVATWTSACANPVPSPGEDAGAVELIINGWEKV